VPAPEVAAPVVSFHDGTAARCAALERVLGNGLHVAALEYLDTEAVALARGSFPGSVPEGAVMVLAEVDGSREEVDHLSHELAEVLGEDALALVRPESGAEIAALWRWRDGVSFAVQAPRGGKVSEDIVVPLDRLAEAIQGTLVIGRRYGLPACSWGHAGDGNLHSTFLLSPADEDGLARAAQAAEDLFELAVRLGGSVSGEHGIGLVKRGQLARQWAPRARLSSTGLSSRPSIRRGFSIQARRARATGGVVFERLHSKRGHVSRAVSDGRV
jgi:FAD/FMN-containing dehydrogenase